MEQNEGNRYTNLIIEILNIRYDTGLIAERQLTKNNSKFKPDLSDNKNSIFVEIKDKIETINRGNVVPELNNLFASYINTFSNPKLTLVVLSRLDQNNRKYCTDYFRKELGRSVEILDIKDLYDLAISYKLNMPNSLKYHFASVEELSNYYLNFLKQLTKEELSILYVEDIFDNNVLLAKDLNESKKSILEIREFYYKLVPIEQDIFYKKIKDFLLGIVKLPSNVKAEIKIPKAFRVESIMNGVEFKDEFFKKGIWQNRTTEDVQIFIDVAQNGDYVVLKSFPSHQGMVLIKGIGVVKSNPHSEQLLEIDWFYKDANLTSSIEGYGLFAEIPDLQWSFLWNIFNNIPEFKNALENGSIRHPFKNRLMIPNSFELTESKEGVIGVYALAEKIATLINGLKTDEKGKMVGVFGNWGRGKTFLMDKIWENLNSEKYKNKYTRVDFHAWKYQDTPASWAYLYEAFSEEYFKSESKNKLIREFDKVLKLIVLNFYKIGVIEILSFILTGLFTWWTFYLIKDLKDFKHILLFTGVFSFSSINALRILKSSFSKGAKELFKKFYTKTSFENHLGVQAEIQKELKILLKTWIKEKNGVINNKIILFVDDIDRCSEERIVQIIDALRVMVEDEEISKRVIVLTSIDERVLKRAIKWKYHDLLIKDCESDEKERAKLSKSITNEYMDKLFLAGINLGALTFEERKAILGKYIQGRVFKDLSVLDSKNESADFVANNDTNTNFVFINENHVDQPDQIGEDSSVNVFNEELYDISSSEELTLLELMKYDDSLTPRQIRIFYYRYLLGRSFLRSKFEENGIQLNKDLIDTFVRLLMHYTLKGNVNFIKQSKIDLEKTVGEGVTYTILNVVEDYKTNELIWMHEVLEIVVAY